MKLVFHFPLVYFPLSMFTFHFVCYCQTLRLPRLQLRYATTYTGFEIARGQKGGRRNPQSLKFRANSSLVNFFGTQDFGGAGAPSRDAQRFYVLSVVTVAVRCQMERRQSQDLRMVIVKNRGPVLKDIINILLERARNQHFFP